VPTTNKLGSDDELFKLAGSVKADKPEKDIYHFIGNITWQHANTTEIEPLSVENTLWANTVVASGTALVLVLYTGSDTRAMMNTSFPGTKVGLLDLEINKDDGRIAGI
jgi:phospholipid-translocating ATPase